MFVDNLKFCSHYLPVSIDRGIDSIRFPLRSVRHAISAIIVALSFWIRNSWEDPWTKETYSYHY